MSLGESPPRVAAVSASGAKPPARPAAPPRRAPSPPPSSGEETEPDGVNAEQASAPRPKLSAVLYAAPSWLLSALVHMAVLFGLALITVSLPEKLQPQELIGHTADAAEEPIIDDVVFDLEPVEMQPVALTAIAATDPGMANLGDAVVAPANLGEVGMVRVDAAMGEIGALFGEAGEGLARNDAGLGAAEFFGVKAGGRKFVFLVDSSRSMKGGKFEAALEELSYAVRKLSREQFFYVIFFDWNAERMLFPVDPRRPAVLKQEPEPRAVRATPENIRHLEAWMGTIELELKTDPYEAMKFAVEMLPDAIYLLTDGVFRGRTEAYLAEHNRIESEIDGPKPKVVIHTIGFWSEEGQDLLKRIAEKYGGSYRFVPPPVKRKR